MRQSHVFLNAILDSVSEHIVVINSQGEIKFVNNSWSKFGEDNACSIDSHWIGVNYIDECRSAAEMGDDFGSKAEEGILRVINRKQPSFYLEYPCHSPEEKRWFMMRVNEFEINNERYFVISHQNITERKLAEEKIKNLAAIDGLTEISNRRAFDNFLHDEWNRCLRLQKPISLAIIDIDYFKLLNDSYGHKAGDDCLKKVGQVIKGFAKRPSDIAARYGGEEFAIVWGDTSIDNAKEMMERLLESVRSLSISNPQSDTHKHLTVSIGLAELIPTRDSDESSIVALSDKMLYQAKQNGRNRIEC